jgi:hypothetical protein
MIRLLLGVDEGSGLARLRTLRCTDA